MLVGLALIGGLLTWLNRRGGCTSRTKRRNHDTFDDFAMNMKDPESANMGAAAAAATAGAGAGASGNGMSPVSPFQRRMAPIAPQTTGYMNLGNDEFSETSTAVPLMNQDMAGYPPAGAGINQHGQPADPYYGYGNTDYKTQLYHQNDGGMDHWQQQQQQQDQQHYYGAPMTSPQSSNQHDHHQMKPDAVDYKPHEI
ncbi:hypothetical protein BCR42DRAFT_427606 [Absidia repens]|uniref:Uncharacterized protein n=1 Tax=Absidia repens TaxID=90262 RepID=A0A1X2HZH4_9FUNG|nr:hypothetical protein BCR42DRAFT_427606 [Absidia repens]